MREELAKILLTYLPSKVSSFRSHPLAHSIRSVVPHVIAKEAAISADYKVDGSAGKGNWAEVPWIGIFDKEITKSAQLGYYIVYLFRSDMKGVYLSLNQGWTQFSQQFKPAAEAKKKIREAAVMLREILSSCQGFEIEKIDLATPGILGQGYELGHICGKYYEKSNLPHELSLIDDLRNLVGVYRELKGRLSGKPLIQELEDYRYERANPYVSEGEKPAKEDFEKVKALANKVHSPAEIDSILEELEKIMAGKEPKFKQRLANAIIRNQKITELVKQKANYICQICKAPGFEKRGGGLYAEAHHIEELAEGGKDLPGNMICVCPLCHRKIHYGKNS